MFELFKHILVLISLFIIIVFFTINHIDFVNNRYNQTNRVYQHKFDKTCEVEAWNEVTTTEIPRESFLRKLARRGITGTEGLSDGELRLLSAYVYHDEIVVTTTRQRTSEVGKTIYCRYYDCNRVEIPNSAFKSFLFPMTAVHCARRAGAEFISLTFNLSESAAKPMPFVKRLAKKPPHELGVCAGQIYGPDRKWMDLVEFVEHHKIIGASMFYFTIFEIEEYSRKLLTEYVRTGYAEVTDVETEYTAMYSYAHMIQLYDCNFRARYHSKWLLNIDHDEFLIPTQTNFLSFIDSLTPTFAEVIFAMKRIHKFEESLKVYNTTEEVISNMQMLKYKKTAPPTFRSPKIMVQPTKVEAIHIHWALGRSPEYRTITIPKSIALVNHYRGDTGLLNPGVILKSLTSINDNTHMELMEKNVVETVEYVFKKHNVTCENIPDDWKDMTMEFLKKMNIC